MTQRTGLFASILSGILFGTSVSVIKLGLARTIIPPVLFATMRFIVASAVILLFLKSKGWVNPTLLKSKPLLTVGVLNTAGYVLQFEGQALTTASDAALIIGSAALMIPIVSWLSRAEKPVARRSLGVFLGFLGTALVVTRGETFNSSGSKLLGDLMILGTAVTIALIFVLSKSLVVKEGSKPVTSGLVLSTSVMLVPFLALDLGQPVSLNVEAWFYVLFLAIFSTVGSYFFLAKALETVSATVSSIILPIEVIVSVGLSVVIFSDPFTAFSAVGAVLIIVGVIMVSLTA